MKRSPLRLNVARSVRGITLRSDDGVITFTLTAAARGLFVERTELRADEARVVQSTLFNDDASFERWCDTDAVRFEYPVLYVRLKHDGDALLSRND